jgi:hypothetical protein
MARLGKLEKMTPLLDRHAHIFLFSTVIVTISSAVGILSLKDPKRTHDEIHFKKNTVSTMTTKTSAKFVDRISPADLDAKKQKTKSTPLQKGAFAIMMHPRMTRLPSWWSLSIQRNVMSRRTRLS